LVFNLIIYIKIFFKRFLIFILIAFLFIQFSRPTKNVSATLAVNDISTKYTIPENVNAVLKASCYDAIATTPNTHGIITYNPWLGI